jgi:hypothetical protein
MRDRLAFLKAPRPFNGAGTYCLTPAQSWRTNFRGMVVQSRCSPRNPRLVDPPGTSLHTAIVIQGQPRRQFKLQPVCTGPSRSTSKSSPPAASKTRDNEW